MANPLSLSASWFCERGEHADGGGPLQLRQWLRLWGGGGTRRSARTSQLVVDESRSKQVYCSGAAHKLNRSLELAANSRLQRWGCDGAAAGRQANFASPAQRTSRFHLPLYPSVGPATKREQQATAGRPPSNRCLPVLVCVG